MQEVNALIAIVTVLAVGAASPGPSFVMVARTAVAFSRRHGLFAALGMGVGAAMFAIAALVGLQAVLLAVPGLYVAIKVMGGFYLAYLGVRIWRGAKQPLIVDAHREGIDAAHGAFMVGFVTQVSNPKTAIVYASVFAALLPSSPSLAFGAAVVGAVLVIETGWYGLVATLLSSGPSRHFYLRYKMWVDRVAGGAMMALGVKLVATVKSP